jgi:wobble nucleotide-excising tRNase
MRITRVTKIRGHRVYRDFAWPNDLHPFGQFNLIYGWNGCGKTTLSSLLAHLQKQANVTEGDVCFEFDESRSCAGSAIASSNLPAVRVFNRDFINATISAVGDQVEPIYYLGEDSVEKQAHAAALKAQLREASETLAQTKSKKATAENQLDGFCINEARKIKEILTGPQSTHYNNYDKRTFKRGIEALKPAEADTARLSDLDKEALRKQKDDQPKEALTEIAFSPPDLAAIRERAETLLVRSVASQALEELTRDKALGAWVQQGLALHSGEHQSDTCRFCCEPLSPLRRAALEGHFNDAFAAFQGAISGVIETVDREITRLGNQLFPDSARAYDHLQGEFAAAATAAKAALSGAMTWLEQVRAGLEAKKAAPFAPSGGVQWQEPPEPEVLPTAIAAVNAIVAKHNEITNDFRSQVRDACKKLERHYLAEAREEFASLNEATTSVDGAIATGQDAVEALKKQIAQLERDIVEHRRPADELNTELRAYLGRDELRFEVKETGYALTRAGQPVSHLSEGERTAIAFLYFLKSLQDRSFELKNGVVVIDDPVSSLDANALFSAFGYMKERTKDCGQLFVLTHNFAFFRQVKNWFHHVGKERLGGEKRPRSRFYMMQVCMNGAGERNSSIGELDPLLREYDSEYHYLFRRVYDEAKKAGLPAALEHHYAMPNIARRLVEAFLAFRYPDSPDLAKRLEHVDNFDRAKKVRVLRLLHTYSHAGGVPEYEHDPSLLAETRPVLCDLLDLIKAVDPTHYEGMEKLVARRASPDDDT